MQEPRGAWRQVLVACGSMGMPPSWRFNIQEEHGGRKRCQGGGRLSLLMWKRGYNPFLKSYRAEACGDKQPWPGEASAQSGEIVCVCICLRSWLPLAVGGIGQMCICVRGFSRGRWRGRTCLYTLTTSSWWGGKDAYIYIYVYTSVALFRGGGYRTHVYICICSLPRGVREG